MLKKLSPLVFLIGCNAFTAQDNLTAEEEIFMRTISAEEDNLVQSVEDDMEGPKLFRECNRSDFFEKALNEYDTNGDQSLQDSEGETMLEQRPKKSKHKMKRMRKMMDLLLWVYDIDQNGSLSETERQELFADFDVRCEAIHDRLLSEFDVDGDGQLSETEMEAIREVMKQKREEHRAQRDGERPEKEQGERTEEQDGLPKFAQEFDVDGDGELSEAEMETFRATLREEIRSGEPFGRCKKQDSEEEIEETEEIEEENAEL